MKIITLKAGQLRTNCYLVIDEDTKKTLIVDPGDDADYVQRVIADEHTTPKVIVATHGHFDHILAVKELQLAYNIPFYLDKKDEFLLDRMQSSCKFFTGYKPGPPPKVEKYLKVNSFLNIGNCRLKVISTPGHTPGGISFYSKRDKVLFVGDLIFADGAVGRTDFDYSSKKDLKESIKKILKLPSDTRVYSGHGSPSRIAVLKKTL